MSYQERAGMELTDQGREEDAEATHDEGMEKGLAKKGKTFTEN